MARKSRSEYLIQYNSDRWIFLKLKAIAYKGGKCQNCGYDKCYAAIEFHHRDPNEKDFDWLGMRKRSWDTITKELDKCDILCATCHREVHYDPTFLENAINRREKRLEDGNSKPRSHKKCEICETMFRPDKPRSKTCSNKCRIKAQERIVWPDDLPQLVQQSSQSAVARLLGVSNKSVSKRLQRYY